MTMNNIRDYRQCLFGLTSGFTSHKVLQTSKAVNSVQSVLVTFGAYLVVRSFARIIFFFVLKIYCVLNNNTFKLFLREHIDVVNI